MTSLDGLVAIVTGGASGIGRAAAFRLAAAGAALVLVDRNQEGAEQVATAVDQAGGRARALAADVAALDDIERTVATAVERFGRIDILFNNAGISRSNPFLEVTPEEWDTQFAVNARGAFFLLQAVARQMVGQEPLAGRGVRGKIVNTASLAAFRPAVVTAAYSATKAVVVNFTRSAALALAPAHITVNAICPGYVDTPLVRDIVAPEIEQASGWAPGEYQQRRSAAVPWGRFARPEEIADLCLFLAGPASDYITGQSINIDGGINMG
ncbi:MAG: glucose 1-dehydrogenase [Ardenticatenaceae bacterium]|nr:glucose 1-dehydrogenase [Ardenticatenaceae bacterium]